MNDIVISVENLSKRYRLGEIGVTTLRESAERAWLGVKRRFASRDAKEREKDEGGDLPPSAIALATADCGLRCAPEDGGRHKPEVRDRRSEVGQEKDEGGDLKPEDEGRTGEGKVYCEGLTPKGGGEELWALRDVSFEVRRGEVLGVIGRNGAGKSTLLKILSRITEPTSGRAVMRGRVGSLLEVGTGFHPELSGRDNIYLSGAILGMKKREIASKFDEIVAFAEVEKFIDTPVKRYSSGMYVRLAFAVAAHLDPEILLVDEVLAVGDAAFQKKCLGKMGDIAGQGRTVLFVSHNMAAVQSLCKKVALLKEGALVAIGDAEEIIAKYISSDQNITGRVDLVGHSGRPEKYKPLLTGIQLRTAQGNTVVPFGEKLEVVIEYNFPTPIVHPQFVIAVYSLTGARIFTLVSDYQRNNLPRTLAGKGAVCCITSPLFLMPGTYSLSVRLWQPGEQLDEVDFAIPLQIEWLQRRSQELRWNASMGLIYTDAEWNLLNSNNAHKKARI